MGSIPDEDDSAIGPIRQGFVDIERPTLDVRRLAAEHVSNTFCPTYLSKKVLQHTQ